LSCQFILLGLGLTAQEWLVVLMTSVIESSEGICFVICGLNYWYFTLGWLTREGDGCFVALFWSIFIGHTSILILKFEWDNWQD
jgi:hypothetical protein